MGEWDPPGGASQEPVVAEAAKHAQHLWHRQPAGQPHRAIVLIPQVARAPDVDGPVLALDPPHRPGPAHPHELLSQPAAPAPPRRHPPPPRPDPPPRRPPALPPP